MDEWPEIDVELVCGMPRGELVDKLGIVFHELSAERAVASMPVAGNRQSFELLHGGAHVALAETLGSFAANVHAGDGKIALGTEIGASHTKSVAEGRVIGTCVALSLGSRMTVHEIVVRDEGGARLSTIRMTNFLVPRD